MNIYVSSCLLISRRPFTGALSAVTSGKQWTMTTRPVPRLRRPRRAVHPQHPHFAPQELKTLQAESTEHCNCVTGVSHEDILRGSLRFRESTVRCPEIAARAVRRAGWTKLAPFNRCPQDPSLSRRARRRIRLAHRRLGPAGDFLMQRRHQPALYGRRQHLRFLALENLNRLLRRVEDHITVGARRDVLFDMALAVRVWRIAQVLVEPPEKLFTCKQTVRPPAA